MWTRGKFNTCGYDNFANWQPLHLVNDVLYDITDFLLPQAQPQMVFDDATDLLYEAGQSYPESWLGE